MVPQSQPKRRRLVNAALPPFEFATASRIIFRSGASRDLVDIAAPLGRRISVVTGSQPSRWGEILQSLRRSGAELSIVSIPGEPTTEALQSAVVEARQRGCDGVLGLGGGSAIDGAKALAGLLPQTGEVLDYLEVVGRGRPLAKPPLPWIAVPTTAGAGAEVTRNAVLTSTEHRVKASLRSPLLLATAVVVDPNLTLDLPPAVTASTGLDALTQVIEPFLCTRANPLTDALCLDAMPRIAQALPRAVGNGHDHAARADMALGALQGGLALANAGLGSVHGLAAPLGGELGAPHGAICAALLPHALELNLQLLPGSTPGPALRHRFDEVARRLTGRPEACAADGIQWLRHLVGQLRIPKLREYGLDPARFPSLAEAALAASSMKANPVPLDRQAVIGLMHAAW